MLKGSINDKRTMVVDFIFFNAEFEQLVAHWVKLMY